MDRRFHTAGLDRSEEVPGAGPGAGEAGALEGQDGAHAAQLGSLAREANILQDEVDAVVQLSKDRNMTISKTKTKALLFNPLRIYDFSPQLSIKEGSHIEVVEEQKILGHIIRSDMKTISNTEYICKKVYRRMWLLQRLKALGCPIPELIDVLKQQVREGSQKKKSKM